MRGVTYQLQSEEGCSDEFYRDLKKLSSEIYPELSQKWASLLKAYKEYICEKEKLRTDQEYMIELLSFMMATERYQGVCERAPSFVLRILTGLLVVRKKNPLLKSLTDPLRGLIGGMFLFSAFPGRKKIKERGVQELKRLLLFLEATGEFQGECARFKQWLSFFKTLPSEGIRLSLKIAREGYLWFKKEASLRLSPYTGGVSSFLKREYKSYRFREDAFLCGKKEEEYHLNMLASQVINEGFLEDFLNTEKRVILVPGCMAWKGGRNCMAVNTGLEIRCIRCTSQCGIHSLMRKCEEGNIELYIVPHTSGFTRWLKKWENTKNTGVTAVACALNIISGGLAMRSHNIPSQCVLLDCSGCKKHWHKEGFDTEVNVSRLLEVASQGRLIS